MNDIAPPRGAGSAVADYKRALQRIMETRPSGTRQRLATSLGTNRSFVSQMANPAYAMPIPFQHLPTIFEVCHFSHAEQQEFLTLYGEAHPERRERADTDERSRTILITVADLGDARRNRVLDEAIARFARQVGRLAEDLES